VTPEVCVSKGTFSGRFIIPLHDQIGQLVGYAGRSINDGKDPKYLFPPGEKGFHKSHLLFNLHRVVKEVEGDQPVVVVEGFFDCMKVHQAGFPCVALLGSSLSEQQEEMLAAEFGRVILMFDGDDAGRSCAEDCARRMVRRMFVRTVELLDGQQPDQLGAEELQRLLRS
jgi:DNA primase